MCGYREVVEQCAGTYRLNYMRVQTGRTMCGYRQVEPCAGTDRSNYVWVQRG